MLLMLITGQHVNAQESKVIYSADFNEIAESWTQEGELVENLWSIQSNSYAAYGFNATGDFTNWLVSPNIKLNTSNEVSFNHLAYSSMFNNLQEEAKFVIREVGGEWVEIEGVQYPTGYDIVNSGKLEIPAEFDNKEVQFAFQYKKMGENTGLWGIADITVNGVEGAAKPEIEAKVIYNADFNEIAESWTQEGELVENLWSIQSNSYAAYGFNATGDFTNWLVSPNIKLNSSNEVSFNHLAYNSMFNNIQEEAKFVIREVGGEWVEIEGVQYPTGYDIVNSGNLAVPAEFNNKEVQFAFQYKKMGENTGLWGIADITVKGVEGSEPEEELALYKLYNEPFLKGFKEAGYTVEGEQGEPSTPLWYDRDGWVTATANNRVGERTDIVSYLVSPEIQLGKDNVARFFHYGTLFNGKMPESVSLCVRENGGEWVSLEGMLFGGNYEEVSTGEMEVPAQFNNKKVQFGFKYTAPNGYDGGCWQLRDFVIKGYVPKKAEAGISFDVKEVIYEIGSGDFNSPVINNPNNLEVYYSSENENVAIIDEAGIVTIVGQGTTLIRALSLQTEEFEKGEASYTLIVKDPNIIYSADFYTDKCGFTEENNADCSVWTRGWENYIMADGYGKVSEMTDFYFVSPAFTLCETGNSVSFDHNGSFFTDWANQAQLYIRETGGEWIKIEGIIYPEDGWTNSGELSIPEELNGKEVEIGFKYSSDGLNNSGIWYVRNLIVRINDVPTSIEGVNAEMMNDGKVYDLQGRRVYEPANGIFIINGKKVVIK